MGHQSPEERTEARMGGSYEIKGTDLDPAWQYPQQDLLIQRYIHLKKSLNDQAPWVWLVGWANLIPCC